MASSVEASDAVAAGAPSQGDPKRQRCQHKEVSASPFAVRSVVVTTDHGAQHTARAQQLAAELGLDGELEACVFAAREGETLVKLLERHAAQAVLVVGATGTVRAACRYAPPPPRRHRRHHRRGTVRARVHGVHCMHPNTHARRACACTCVHVQLQMLRLSNGSEHKLHGGMGVLRLRNVAGGGADNMVDACGLRSGDVFIDATAGQLSDALVAAHVVGPEGHVLAIEVRRTVTY
jgi:hypothetical protein